MQIFVMTDMEGSAGVLNHDDWVMPAGHFFDQGRRLLTEETNAAIDGLFKGGADEVVVCDGHGAGGINPELLDKRAKLLRGGPSIYPYMQNNPFDAICWVGQHAKAGTDYSHITHTQWFNYIDLEINGTSIGEFGQATLCAMERGIRCILACGEKALCEEAQALTPGIVTVAVKEGLTPDGLDHLTEDQYRAAKLDAIHRSPEVARELIQKGALKAITRLKADPESFSWPTHIQPPYVRTAKFRKSNKIPDAYEAFDEHPSSLLELIQMPYTPVK